MEQADDALKDQNKKNMEEGSDDESVQEMNHSEGIIPVPQDDSESEDKASLVDEMAQRDAIFQEFDHSKEMVSSAFELNHPEEQEAPSASESGNPKEEETPIISEPAHLKKDDAFIVSDTDHPKEEGASLSSKEEELTDKKASLTDELGHDEKISARDLNEADSPTCSSPFSITSPNSRTSSLPQSPGMTPSVTITPPRTSSAPREPGEIGRDFQLTWEGEPGRLILSPERLTFRPISPVQAAVHPFLSIPYELIYAVSVSPKDPATTLIHTIHPRNYSLCSFRITEVDPAWLIQSLRAHLPPSPPYAHVFINPYAGTGGGLELWEGLVRPMLLNARIPHAVTVTTGPGNAESLSGSVALEESKDAASPSVSSTSSENSSSSFSSSASSSFRKPTAIICIGGDGLVHEVVNGLASRGTPRPVVQLCVVPAGTGNTVANTVIYQEGDGESMAADINARSLRSLLACFRCQHIPLDLATVALTDGRIRRAVALVNTGFHADVSSSSDRLRFLGPSSRSRLAGAVQYLFPTRALDEARITLLGARRWSASYRAFSAMEPVVELEDGPFADVLITNHPELSNGYRIAPFADPSDGFWDLIVIRGGRAQVHAVQSAASSPTPTHLADGLAECWQIQGLHLQIPHLGESVRVDGEPLILPPAGDDGATTCELTLQIARDELIRLCKST
ncbi:ATP-NAD kinase-like domain-containing protein [Piptocephalis cylindrospora]|uniref:ATP-NAD kinase-like domain-containing protein n=1 Tax=Piptocephalis cylindrospora TaxID=1907219 RepID=A0A4V1IXQ3_9FUNG|nr:ATP-NAD kinase-like domain-containing protein [Piptocephalis cylindrospora]|eukprot:RKP11859.1 ATP-NAD kinase-like domain-containing protein [Piptocephalis cylindrospora]